MEEDVCIRWRTLDLKCFRKGDFIFFRVNFACYYDRWIIFTLKYLLWKFFSGLTLLLFHVKRVDGPLFWSCSGTHATRFSVKVRFFRRTERKTKSLVQLFWFLLPGSWRTTYFYGAIISRDSKTFVQLWGWVKYFLAFSLSSWTSNKRLGLSLKKRHFTG